jgi:AraC-like DNA-binding protein
MDRRVQIVIKLMKENLSQELLIDDVAKWLNISPSRLRYLFKAETGQSPAQYLKHLRMQKAKLLVESTFLNVKQIMYELGINDESHFVRDFKRTYGVTITQYRHVCNNNFCEADDLAAEQVKWQTNS